MQRTLFLTFPLLAAALSSTPASAQLVTNGGFETEPGAPGWTTSGTGISIDSVFPNQGNFDAAFSAAATAPNPGVLSQTITTVPGQSYRLDFVLLDESGFSGDSFNLRFGTFASTIAGDTVAPPGNLPSLYTSESFTIPGGDVTGTSTILSFQGLNAGGPGIAFNLDDVSLGSVSTPEPASAALLAPLVLVAFRRKRRV